MAKATRPEIVYYERGTIESGRNRLVGYSANGPNGGPLYPWMSYVECVRDAKAQGGRAVFVTKDGRRTR